MCCEPLRVSVHTDLAHGKRVMIQLIDIIDIVIVCFVGDRFVPVLGE